MIEQTKERDIEKRSKQLHQVSVQIKSKQFSWLSFLNVAMAANVWPHYAVAHE